MMPELLITSGIILVLLVLSGFFSGSETALTAASRARMHSLAKQGDRRAAIVLALLDRNERLIGGILLGNNLVNILASALATSMLMGVFGEAGVVYATLGMTFLVLVFAEVLPKTWALNHADNMSLRVAPAVRILVAVLAPVTHAIYVVVRTTLRPFGVVLGAELGREQAEEDLRGAIDLQEVAIRHDFLRLGRVDEGAVHVDIAVKDVVLRILMCTVHAFLHEKDGDLGTGQAADIGMEVYWPPHLLLDRIERLAGGAELLPGDRNTADAFGRSFDQPVDMRLAGGPDDHDVVRAVPGRLAHCEASARPLIVRLSQPGRLGRDTAPVFPHQCVFAGMLPGLGSDRVEGQPPLGVIELAA